MARASVPALPFVRVSRGSDIIGQNSEAVRNSRQQLTMTCAGFARLAMAGWVRTLQQRAWACSWPRASCTLSQFLGQALATGVSCLAW